VVEAKRIGRDDLDEALYVHAGRNRRPLELWSHESDWLQGGEWDSVRDMICQLLGDGLRDVHRTEEVHMLGVEEAQVGAQKRDGIARGCPLSVFASELEFKHPP